MEWREEAETRQGGAQQGWVKKGACYPSYCLAALWLSGMEAEPGGIVSQYSQYLSGWPCWHSELSVLWNTSGSASMFREFS